MITLKVPTGTQRLYLRTTGSARHHRSIIRMSENIQLPLWCYNIVTTVSVKFQKGR